MATAPNLVVAGDSSVARKLRETGRFPAVFEVSSATELRDLSKTGTVVPPAAFMFAPGFVEDLPGAGVPVLANGLAATGLTVLVHRSFADRGDVFDPAVRVTARQVKLSELLATLGAAPAPAARSAAPSAGAPARRAAPAPRTPASRSAVPRTPASQTTALRSATPVPQAAPVPQPPMPQAAPVPQPVPQAPVPQAPVSQAVPASPWAPAPPPPGRPAPDPVSEPAGVPEPRSGARPPVADPPDGVLSPRQAGTEPAPAARRTAAPPAPEPEAPPASPGELVLKPDLRPAPASNGWPARQAARPNPWAADTASSPEPGGRVIAVASAKGGVGKTSMTVSLSVYAARLLQAAGRPGTAVLVDTNFQQADVARYLNLDSPTILDLFQTPGALSPAGIRNHLAQVPEIGLSVLLGPPEAVNADPAFINSLLYRRILAVLRQTFDFVFIDTPVAELYHTTFTDLILPEADAILIPVEPNRVTLEAARSWLKAITMPQHARGGGVAPERLSLILNRARADVDCSPEDVMDLMPGWRFVGMIPEDNEWIQAVNNHRLVAMRPSPALDATFRQILLAATGDPVFRTTALAPPATGGRWKRLLGLDSK